MSMQVQELSKFLEDAVNKAVGKLETSAEESKVEDPEKMLQMLLKAALKNEWETAQLTSHWVINEKNHKFAVLLTRLAGDEAKHYLMIEKMVLGEFEVGMPDSPLYNHLLSLTDTFSRVVAGPFMREYLAVKRNKLFLKFCEKYSFTEVHEMYQVIQEEENFHHQLGVEILERLLKTDEQLSRAKDLISEMLNIVDDMHEMASIKKGLHYLPGC